MMSPLFGEKTMSKSRYPIAKAHDRALDTQEPDRLTDTAMSIADAEEATVPARYIAEILDFETVAMDDLRVERVRIGKRRARAPSLSGSALARVVRPNPMFLNLIPAIVPTP